MFKKAFLLLLIITFILYLQPQGEKLFLIGLPKSGTHLLEKCLRLITDFPRVASWNRLFLNESQVKNINNFTIFSTHALCIEENIKILKKYNFRGFFIYRDPRDQIVSMMHYIYRFGSRPADNLEDLREKPLDELFDICLHDYGYIFSRIWDFNYRRLDLKKLTIADIYRIYLSWHSESFIYATSFEKLVGPLGGGTLENQLHEISNILHHLGLNFSQEKVKKIADDLFGGSQTFREGKIGAWKKYFNEERKNKFKLVAGKLLIDLGYEKDFDW